MRCRHRARKGERQTGWKKDRDRKREWEIESKREGGIGPAGKSHETFELAWKINEKQYPWHGNYKGKEQISCRVVVSPAFVYDWGIWLFKSITASQDAHLRHLKFLLPKASNQVQWSCGHCYLRCFDFEAPLSIFNTTYHWNQSYFSQYKYPLNHKTIFNSRPHFFLAEWVVLKSRDHCSRPNVR